MYSIVGYTCNQGYCLCEEHAEYGEMEDEGSGDGKVQPIFENSEWDTDVICSPCYDKLFASGGNVRDSILMHANIGPAAIWHQWYHDENDRIKQAIVELQEDKKDITYKNIVAVYNYHGVTPPDFDEWSEYFLQNVWGK